MNGTSIIGKLTQIDMKKYKTAVKKATIAYHVNIRELIEIIVSVKCQSS